MPHLIRVLVVHDGEGQLKSRFKDFLKTVVGGALDAVGAVNRRLWPLPVSSRAFVTGAYAPMEQEFSLEDLPVTGTIPPELDGQYCRMGPNPCSATPRDYHWFMGDGMVHVVRIHAGKALWYRNRWIRSTHVGRAKHWLPASGTRRGVSDTVNTHIIPHAGSLWALMEAISTPVRLNLALDSQVYDDFRGTLSHSFSAHPHLDPSSGELHAIAYEARELDLVRHIVVDAEGKVRRELDIPVQHGPLIHDCALTARYVIVLDLPVTISFRAVLRGYQFPFRWNPSHPSRVGLLPREGASKDIIWVDVDPCFVFHTVNAFDLPDGPVVLDVVAYDHMFTSASQGPDTLPRGLERWVIDPVQRTMKCQSLHPKPQEFPRINESRTGLPYRFAYAVGLPERQTPEALPASFILKHDLESATTCSHDFGAGRLPTEFVFVPRRNAEAEDGGWLMGFVVDPASASTDLVILDAEHFDAEPVASIYIPHRIPLGFHGSWTNREDKPE